MLKTVVGLMDQIDQKLKYYFSNSLFLAENIFYYYAILLLCFITSIQGVPILRSQTSGCDSPRLM